MVVDIKTRFHIWVNWLWILIKKFSKGGGDSTQNSKIGFNLKKMSVQYGK